MVSDGKLKKKVCRKTSHLKKIVFSSSHELCSLVYFFPYFAEFCVLRRPFPWFVLGFSTTREETRRVKKNQLKSLKMDECEWSEKQRNKLKISQLVSRMREGIKSKKNCHRYNVSDKFNDKIFVCMCSFFDDGDVTAGHQC